MTSDLAAAAGTDALVEVVMTLEVVHRDGSFRLSKVKERVPIPIDLFCLCNCVQKVYHVTVTGRKFITRDNNRKEVYELLVFMTM